MIKPCPFCGGDAKVYHTGGLVLHNKNKYYVSHIDHENCAVIVRSCYFKTKQEVIKAWNTRK